MDFAQRKHLRSFLILFAALLMIAGPSYGADKQVRQGGVGLKAGFLVIHTIYIEYDMPHHILHSKTRA